MQITYGAQLEAACEAHTADEGSANILRRNSPLHSDRWGVCDVMLDVLFHSLSILLDLFFITSKKLP